MSFILDALRKSELERQRQSGPSIAKMPIARDDRRLPWALLAIGLLLAVNVGVLLFFLLRDATAPAETVDTSGPTLVVAAPAAAAPAAAASMPAPVNELPAAESPVAEIGTPDAGAVPGQASLPPPAPDPTLLPDAPATAPVIYGSEPATDFPPSIDELPAQATAGLPELSVDLHIYTDDPAKRAVFINGRRYQQGGVLVEGPTVEEITREGAVLKHHGRRFLLPRL